MQYRSHIDGLRALAILFVLLFHAGLSLFPSGFIGVDIFFVISGFLITSIIHQSMQKSQFSFITFYKRRLWRLQPVFICLILMTAIVALVFYLPEDLIFYAKSARKTLSFTSNQFFGQATAGYFAPENNQLSLLHTWSLAIEWQCYLILPIVLYLLYRIFGEHLPKVIYLLTALAIIFSLYNSFSDTNHTYYQLVSRIFEFLIGSSVALGSFSTLFNKWNKYLVNLITAVAVAIVFLLATRHDISVGFPNEYAIILCLAIGVLIVCGDLDYKPLGIRLLSLKPMIFIGLLSYSLYIWHWPVFALIHYLDFAQTSSTLLMAFSLLFVMAYLSWQFIEKPARKMSDTKASYTIICLLVMPFSAAYLGAHLINTHEGYPQRFEAIQTISEQLKLHASELRSSCLVFKNTPVDKKCMIGSNNPENKMGFMIGDSFSNHYWKFMDVFAEEAGLSILAHSTATCLALPGVYQYHWLTQKGVYEVCAKQTAQYYQMIEKNHYDFVIIGESWNGYLTDQIVNNLNDKRSLVLTKQRIEKGIDDALQRIVASGAKPVLIKAIATDLEGNSNSCFFKHIKNREPYYSERCDYTLQPGKQKWINAVFARMQKKYSQLIVIDPQKILCTNNVCKADINQVPVFRDKAHLTDYAAYQLGIEYKKKYDNPFVS